MKLIVAVVRPLTLDRIVVALEDIENFPGITVSNAEGFGQRIRARDEDALNPFKSNRRLEILANDEMVESIVDAINRHAHTGRKGDGIILVLPVDDALLI